jgi:hypothetical protein
MDANTEYAVTRAICQEADVLVATGTGAAALDVMERLRLKMNDALQAKECEKAEAYAEVIFLRHAGYGEAADAIERLLR